MFWFDILHTISNLTGVLNCNFKMSFFLLKSLVDFKRSSKESYIFFLNNL